MRRWIGIETERLFRSRRGVREVEQKLNSYPPLRAGSHAHRNGDKSIANAEYCEVKRHGNESGVVESINSLYPWREGGWQKKAEIDLTKITLRASRRRGLET